MMILVINPGSTSTKMAVFEDEKPILLTSPSLAPRYVGVRETFADMGATAAALLGAKWDGCGNSITD